MRDVTSECSPPLGGLSNRYIPFLGADSNDTARWRALTAASPALPLTPPTPQLFCTGVSELQRLLIGGEWVAAESAITVTNPYTEEPIARVAACSDSEVDTAVGAAEAGAREMARLPAHARHDILDRAARLLSERADDFTATIIAEAGKPRRYAAAEVARAVETLRFAAAEALRIHGETVPMDAAHGSETRRGFWYRRPLGVVAAITPFNFPLNLVCHKLAPAFAAGNAVVLKPASATPLTALKLAELLLEAGLPPLALNVVVGSGSGPGLTLVRDERVRLVSFTGSPEVGATIKRETGLRRVALELGSNSGAIVDETADLDAALNRCLAGAFAYSGQVCIHTQRLYLQDSIAAEFTERFVAAAERLICDDPALPDTDVGPMINRTALASAQALIEQAVAAGARLLCGGRSEGTILYPTVLANARPDMAAVCEEAFAPIVTIETFNRFEEGLQRYNAGSSAGRYSYGLTAGVFTRDLGRAFQAIETLNAGSIYINDSATFRADHQPYGGVRDSGIGREGPRFAIEEMTDVVMVSFNLA